MALSIAENICGDMAAWQHISSIRSKISAYRTANNENTDKAAMAAKKASQRVPRVAIWQARRDIVGGFYIRKDMASCRTTGSGVMRKKRAHRVAWRQSGVAVEDAFLRIFSARILAHSHPYHAPHPAQNVHFTRVREHPLLNNNELQRTKIADG